MTTISRFHYVGRSTPVAVPPLGLEGVLEFPEEAEAVILFAHGSGSSRHSPRNSQVAKILCHAGLATLLFDLLTEEEAADRRRVFDIGLLAQRLEAAAEFVAGHDATAGLPLGLFGASTGAAAALVAAARQPGMAGAVVSRGGRPDLAGEAELRRVTAPTMLVVGSEDREVLALNREAQARMSCPTELCIVPGASHLFEEPGTLDRAARLAAGWFLRWLAEPDDIPL